VGQRIRVGVLEDLEPGRGKRVEFGGRCLALFRVDDRVYAIGAVCPHRGGPLEEGELEGETVVCPWHGYDFNLTTGESRAAPALRTPTVPVIVEGGEIFLVLD
jgi:nitrite reductase/ring-hydroxylating ferredoxin subunit